MVRIGRAGLLVAYYGDDFTGSTDVMEALASAGLRTVLFLKPPTRSQLARFPGLRAFGIAGSSRTMSPAEMGRALPPVFRALKGSGARIAHYKVCSTFDSSPEIGSIGHAIDIAQRIFKSPTVPLLVGAPPLGRYCVFGNLFARSGLDTEPYRLDRHPTMSQHPITPMRESDLRAHLAEQTSRTIALFDVLKLEAAEPDAEFCAVLNGQPDIVLFDALADRHLRVAGRLVWQLATTNAPLFTVGSSGVEYALTAHWQPDARPKWTVDEASQTVAVSGSCSPVTERQINDALRRGFEEVAVHPATLLDAKRRDVEFKRVVDDAVQSLRRGRSVIVHTSVGPKDPRIAATRRALSRAGLSAHDQRLKSSRLLGPLLGRVLGQILDAHKLQRVIVAGGDTSWHVANELGIDALEVAAPMAPGSPLCRVHSSRPGLRGLEIVFKGGQVGHDDFFSSVLGGQPRRVGAGSRKF